MLWLGLHFPALPVAIFSRGGAAPEPLAVAEKQGRHTRVAACNAAGLACGVRPGMPVSAAQALASGLVVRTRDPAAEQESLSGLAAWAGRFTPAVSLQPPTGLLLEIGSCLRLHHGLGRLLGQMLAGLKELGYASSHACAPTAQGAWLLARAGTQTTVRELAELEQAIAVLPVCLLDQPADILDGLEKIGAHTLGDCLRLPRAGAVRRFGRGLLDELDRALGRLPEARAFFVPPPTFERRLTLPAPVQEAEALLFAARRLLPELEGWLGLRQAGVDELELACCHENAADTLLRLGFVQPTGAAERMLLLLRETLACTRLPAPVDAIVLHARRILPLTAASGDLFQAQATHRGEPRPFCQWQNAAGRATDRMSGWALPQGRVTGTPPASREAGAGRDELEGDGKLLLERLRIRLGKEAVHGVAPAADHRPERAWRPCAAGDEAVAWMKRSAIQDDASNRKRSLVRDPSPDSDPQGRGSPGLSGIAPASRTSRPSLAVKRQEPGRDAALYPGYDSRPLWLLPQPRPCRDGRLVLQAGPERIESGWWDGMEVARDYYVAQDRHGARLWVYCEHASGAWFVHGLFA